ncbi:hypothetical protein J7I93_17925 [Bacillus sp. ISL-47]|uniref:YpoC family protein n=1 Tax=Bacillus sp. ISL-47 TaxID=2819130 RepID=UPI001BE9BC9A|nr:hypothetical protein [Bacillus sp. ISL-47]MBT2690050.1 hypothetical protein [Bacillus sp. ISL-47]MBT2707844.1 hypothetical protein [Pseudomonas sp. ISL-84]
MNGQLIIPIAAQLCQPLFNKQQEEITLDERMLKIQHLDPPFLYDAAYYAGIEALKPWEKKEECIPVLQEEWKEQKWILDKCFANRNQKAAEEPIKTAIGLFLQLLFWTNGKPVDFQAEVGELKIKPVNLEERLDFIFERPASYHAYIQLSELMYEIEKQYMKHITLENIKKKAPGGK